MALVPAVDSRSPMDRAGEFSRGAISARSAQRTSPSPPPKTAGGAISSAAGMGMAGGMVGSMFASEAAVAAGGIGALGGPWFLAAGAAIGLGSYLLS